MSSQDAKQIEFKFLADLPVVVQRHEGQLTSDAGLLPIAQFDRRWNYTARMAACLEGRPSYDPGQRHRKPQTQHQRTEMLRQRLIDFTIATGIERLKEKHGGSLPASVTLDLDATDDPTHGHQQLTLFHGYFGQYQYFPLILSEPTTKHVFVAWLRPGTVHASLGADDDLMRVVNALRKERPDIQIHVRGDGGFGLPLMYEICEKNGLTYTFGFSTNPRLKRLTEGLLQRAVDEHGKTKQKSRLFDCFQYQCDSWPISRTVIAKAECHDGGTNQRFVVTNRAAISSPEDAQREYDDYVQRGESEQRMDELKNGLHMDRLSCHRFMANFFRLLLHVAAMNLLGALRQSDQLPQVLQVGQPCTWRTCIVKVAALVVQTTRRIVVRVAAHWPWWPLYEAVASRSLSFIPGAASALPSS